MEIDDKEIAVMIELYGLLKPLDRPVQDRVVAFVTHRLLYEASIEQQKEYAAQQLSQDRWENLSSGALHSPLYQGRK